jgi:hypothetical protein
MERRGFFGRVAAARRPARGHFRAPNWTRAAILPMERGAGATPHRRQVSSDRSTRGDSTMGKGNNSQKNDKKSMKPKQEKAKPAPKK